MTGKEWLSKYIATHDSNDVYEKLHWLLREYGMNFHNTPLAIKKWLDEEQPMCNPADVAEDIKEVR